MRVKKRILFFCIVVLSMLVFCEIGSAKLKKVSKKIIVVYEEKNGVIEKVNIAKRIIWIYDLNRNKRIRYKLSKKCKIITVQGILENEVKRKYIFLRKGYRVKILINPYTKEIEKIYIKEIPK